MNESGTNSLDACVRSSFIFCTHSFSMPPRHPPVSHPSCQLEEHRYRLIDCYGRAGCLHMDQSVWRRYTSPGPGQLPQAGRDTGDGVTGFGRGDTEGIKDQIFGGGATPAMDVGSIAPILADGVIAIDQKVEPAPVQLG